MTTHSSGPWTIKRGEIVSKDKEYLGLVYRTEAWSFGNKVKTEDQANACLIAAAPKLLEARKYAANILTGENYRRIQAVIDQAEGKT